MWQLAKGTDKRKRTNRESSGVGYRRWCVNGNPSAPARVAVHDQGGRRGPEGDGSGQPSDRSGHPTDGSGQGQGFTRATTIRAVATTRRGSGWSAYTRAQRRVLPARVCRARTAPAATGSRRVPPMLARRRVEGALGLQ